MGLIAVLDEMTASQIAAGEVVERPSSVVKELVENSLDAEASRITVETRGGGAGLVTVTDDGTGMEREDALLAFSRHATSKVRSARDLVAVRTLGFRGEALPSIASVSKVEMVTRVAGSVAGLRVCVEGGKVSSVGEAGSSPGTRISVRSLFYNTPARKEFLGSQRGENAAITDVVTRLALSWPQVAFRLVQEGRETLVTTGQGDSLLTVAELFGKDLAERLLPTGPVERNGLRVKALAGDRETCRPSRRRQFYFVNNRSISSAVLRRASEEGTRGSLPCGSYPFLLLFVEAEPGLVDANVHPGKCEVRFKDERAVFLLVSQAVKQAYARDTRDLEPSPGWAAIAEAAPSYMEVGQGDLFGEWVDAKEGWRPALRVLGQAGNTYIVAEGNDGIYLVDQHAAHEMVTFRRLEEALKGGRTSQELMMPVTAHLGPGEAAAWLGNRDYLKEMGIHFDHLGGDTITVRAVPQPLEGSVSPSLLAEFTERLLGTRAPGDLPPRQEALLALAACHASVRAGETLRDEEMACLLQQVGGMGFPGACPHGRPVMVRITWEELERRFGRR
jgi:DNA mismatch repair protein MutL